MMEPTIESGTVGSGPAWTMPTSLEEVLEIRATLGDAATLVAGGTFLGILIRSGLARPMHLVSLAAIPELRTVEVRDGTLILGAMATHREVERSFTVRTHAPMLADAFGVVASPRIRNLATVGGVLRDADYASDPPAALAALDAKVVLASRTERREIPVTDFIIGQYETQLRDDEVITAVHVPAGPPTATYLKFRTRSSEDRPCVGVAAALDVDESGIVRALRIVVGAVAPRLQWLPDVCSAAIGERWSEVLIQRVAAGYAARTETITDLRGTAAYRRRLVRVLVRRALEGAAR